MAMSITATSDLQHADNNYKLKSYDLLKVYQRRPVGI